jgi:flagellar biosynthesis protein FlhA
MEELLTKADVRRILDQVSESDPQLVEDLIPSLLSIGDLRKILINLLREQVSIRDISYILERLEDFGQTIKDTDLLSEKIRISMSRQLCEQHSKNETITAIDLCPDIQKQMEESLQRIDDKFMLTMEFDQAKRVIGKIVESTTKIYNQL